MPFKTNKTAEEKLFIVLEGLKAETTISDLCRKHGLSQTLYYKWRDKFLDGGKKGLPNGFLKKKEHWQQEFLIPVQTSALLLRRWLSHGLPLPMVGKKHLLLQEL